MARWDYDRVRAWVRRWARLDDGALPVWWSSQRDFLAHARALQGEDGVWTIALKSRQVGITTVIINALLGIMATTPWVKIAFVTPARDYHARLRSKLRDILSHVRGQPGVEWPGTELDNESLLQAANGAQLWWCTVGGSEGTAETVGRAGTFDLAYLAELAFPALEDVHLLSIAIQALMPALEKRHAPVIVDSTPADPMRGGAVYYDVCQRAWSGRLPGPGQVLFWPPWQDGTKLAPLGTDPVTFGASLTREEVRLIRRGATVGYVAYRRASMRKPGMTRQQARVSYLLQNPEDERAAFQSMTQAQLFDGSLMLELQTRRQLDAFAPPLTPQEVADALVSARLDIPGVDLLTSPQWGVPEDKLGDGYCRLWRLPERASTPRVKRRKGGLALLGRGETRGLSYYGGLDGADGLPDGDWQVLSIEDETGRLCAYLRARIDRLRFAAAAQRLLMLYGASARVERQGGGELIASYLTRAQSPQSLTLASVPRSELEILETPLVGVVVMRTTEHNRARIIDGAISALGEPDGCPDPETLGEMEALERRGGVIKARPGAHDDIVLSRGLARVCSIDLRQGRQRERRKGRSRRALSALTSSRGRSGRFSYLE